ncbi:proteasome assembly chaperone 3-like [Lineus longissimus]|uniref:proteasome assembly chaperone 3-like n=1 Tax=Lineus longissimus TaxID=88925 RepID=UPI002B4E3E1E
MAAPMTKFSVPVKQNAALINDIHTEVVCSNYNDVAFIIVTQYQKMGTLMDITKDVVLEDRGDATYTTKVLLGKDEPILHVIAKQIVTKINLKKPVLLSLALKDTSRETLRAILGLLEKATVW